MEDTKVKLFSFLSSLHKNLQKTDEEIVFPEAIKSEPTTTTTKSKDKKALCPICGDLFLVKRRRENLKRHIKDRSFQCEKCPKNFKDSADLSRHNETCHSTRGILLYTCDYCQKELKCKKTLRKHIIQFHVPDLFPSLACVDCNKVFGDRARLKRHAVVHKRQRGEFIEVSKDFECSKCLKRFASNTHLRQHMAVHTQLKKYICAFCKQGFNFFSSMRNHERNIHGRGTNKKSEPTSEKKLEIAAYTEVASEPPNFVQNIFLIDDSNTEIEYFFS